MSETTRTRRAVLTSLTLAVGLSVTPPLAQALRADGSEEIAEALRFLIFRRDAAVRIGASYRRLHAQEADPHVLRTLTLSALASPAQRMPGSSLPSRLHERIRQEFQTGDTVLLEGWVLSRTEARLCALLA